VADVAGRVRFDFLVEHAHEPLWLAL
jgi:hypothetical protein